MLTPSCANALIERVFTVQKNRCLIQKGRWFPAPEVAEFALVKPAGGLTVEDEVGREVTGLKRAGNCGR
jgi:hypothetical protein